MHILQRNEQYNSKYYRDKAMKQWIIVSLFVIILINRIITEQYIFILLSKKDIKYKIQIDN